MRRKIIVNNFLDESNNKIIELIKSNKPFIISRTGGEETSSSIQYIITNKIFSTNNITNNAGIYFRDDKDKILFFRKHCECFENSDLLATFESIHVNLQKKNIK